jgi:glutaminase
VRAFEDSDTALEWGENRLLAEFLPGGVDTGRTVAPAEYEVFAGLDAEALKRLVPLLQRRRYALGDVLVRHGDPARELFLVARGAASVTVELASGRRKRLATFSAGMAFGEMALLDGAPRSAGVTADTEVECDLLRVEDFERLEQTDPATKIVLLKNLALGLSAKLRKANREISVFES